VHGIFLQRDTDAAGNTVTDTDADGPTYGSAPNGGTDGGSDRNSRCNAAHATADGDGDADAHTDTEGEHDAQRAPWSCCGRARRRGRDDRFVGVDLASLLELNFSEVNAVPPLDSLLLMLTMTRV